MSVPPSSRHRCDDMHAELTALRGPGGPLVAPPGDLAAFFTDSAQREVVFEYREQRSDAPSNISRLLHGVVAVSTADTAPHSQRQPRPTDSSLTDTCQPNRRLAPVPDPVRLERH